MNSDIAEDSRVLIRGTVTYVTSTGMASVRLASGALIALPAAELVQESEEEPGEGAGGLHRPGSQQ